MAVTPRVGHVWDVCSCAVSGMLWGESGWVLAGTVQSSASLLLWKICPLEVKLKQF